ncbi:peptidase S8/S53 domain-containing protein [Xylariales sp. PMI_506]|nr:peptidase S8/S53 domain-containing protein [Xylariales sp. PMI_506]
MIVNTIIQALVVLASGSLALPSVRSDTSVFETLKTLPKGWSSSTVQSFVREDEEIELRIQLMNQNMGNFYQKVIDIATPGHELYRKFMSAGDIDAIIAPSQQSHDLVLNWLKSEGFADDDISLNKRGNTLLVKTNVAKAESLLSAEYKNYTDSITGETAIRTTEFSVPTELLSHIKQIQPTSLFGFRSFGSNSHNVASVANATSQAVVVDATVGCSSSDGGVSPECLANLYGFNNITLPTGGMFGIAGFGSQLPSITDVSLFLEQFAFTNNTGYLYNCISDSGGAACEDEPSFPGAEPDLDVEFGRSMVGTIPITFYSSGGGGIFNIFEIFAEYLVSLDNADLPNTISFSYGDVESGLTSSVLTATCDMFAELGARGVSLLFASGDSGVGSSCSTSYEPFFPATCPWVTAVGGVEGVESAATQSAWGSGGGGFSSFFETPSYQSAAVSQWLSSNTDGGSEYYNSSGRGLPDVASVAANLYYVYESVLYIGNGTSWAAPTFSSIIQLINSELIAAGDAPLGFLNPLLYQNPSALYDITTGSISGCTNLDGGFSAVDGWDPATGLGAPNYPALLAAAQAVATSPQNNATA